jgi:hypothetical protein
MKLNADLKVVIDEKINNIYNFLINYDLSQEKISLYNGKIGIILSLIYINSTFKKNDTKKLKLLIDNMFNNLDQNDLFQSLGTGWAGIGWFFNHVNQNNLLKIDSNTVINKLDLILINSIDSYKNNIDFIHGLAGLLWYFVDRKDPDKIYVDKILPLIFDKIEVIDNGYKSINFYNPLTEEYGLNIGLSHGLASILVIFSRIYELKLSIIDLKPLISNFINFILSNENTNNLLISSFPNNVGEDNKNSRLAWCYGDLGICYSLYYSCKIIGNESGTKKVKELLSKTIKRVDVFTTGVQDGSFCHGSFGIAYMYFYMSKLTEDQQLYNSAIFWLEDGLSRMNFEQGYCGYMKKYKEIYINDAGIIEGLSGVLLVLQSFSNNNNKSNLWSKMFLLNN